MEVITENESRSSLHNVQTLNYGECLVISYLNIQSRNQTGCPFNFARKNCQKKSAVLHSQLKGCHVMICYDRFK